MEKVCKNCSWLVEIYHSFMPGKEVFVHYYCGWFKSWTDGEAVRLFDDEMEPSPLWCPLKEEQ